MSVTVVTSRRDDRDSQLAQSGEIVDRGLVHTIHHAVVGDVGVDDRRNRQAGILSRGRGAGVCDTSSQPSVATIECGHRFPARAGRGTFPDISRNQAGCFRTCVPTMIRFTPTSSSISRIAASSRIPPPTGTEPGPRDDRPNRFDIDGPPALAPSRSTTCSRSARREISGGPFRRGRRRKPFPGVVPLTQALHPCRHGGRWRG